MTGIGFQRESQNNGRPRGKHQVTNTIHNFYRFIPSLLLSPFLMPSSLCSRRFKRIWLQQNVLVHHHIEAIARPNLQRRLNI